MPATAHNLIAAEFDVFERMFDVIGTEFDVFEHMFDVIVNEVRKYSANARALDGKLISNSSALT
jgi:hypothetical protein